MLGGVECGMAKATGHSPCSAVEMGELSVQPLKSTEDLRSEDERDEPSAQVTVPFRWMVIKFAITIFGFVLLAVALEYYVDAEVTALSRQFMRFLGIPGLFLCVLLADSVPQPFTYVPLIFVAIKGSVAKPVVLGICAVASYAAALIGYLVGRKLRAVHYGAIIFGHLSVKYPFVEDLMRRRGAVGVAITAMLPIPLAIATWTAGSFRIHFPSFMLAGMMRIPKIAVFVALSKYPDQSGGAASASNAARVAFAIA
jgi:membrane protein YqaA with SNARE-associated domain